MNDRSENSPEFPSVPPIRALATTRGIKHASRDEYYYRPLVVGEKLFSYVAHVAPRGTMPADAEEAEQFELSIFMIEGELELILGDERRVVKKGDAQFVPRRVPFGVENHSSEEAASFVMTFAPGPEMEDLDEYLDRVESAGRHVYSPEEIVSITRTVW